jgi:hypothetical protein
VEPGVVGAISRSHIMTITMSFPSMRPDVTIIPRSNIAEVRIKDASVGGWKASGRMQSQIRSSPRSSQLIDGHHARRCV